MKYIYISGKITDNPDWKEQFKIAEMKLKAQGYVVVNPAFIAEELEKENPTPTYKDYLQADLRILLICNCIYMLPNWHDSKGAKLEHAIAEALEMEIIYEEMES